MSGGSDSRGAPPVVGLDFRLFNPQTEPEITMTADPRYDCLTCAACCHQKEGTILVTEQDVEHWAAIGRQDLIDSLGPGHFGERAFLMREEDGACVHLGLPGKPNHCQVYEDRATVCREFEAGCQQCREFRKLRGIPNPAP